MTTVTLADGTQYPIPTGQPGTWPWAREASLISVAYQQAGDYTNALSWRKEYERRSAAYNQIGAGADMEAIIDAGSWLDGPREIVAYLATKVSQIIDGAAQIPSVLVDTAKWVPIIALGVLGVVALGFHKGTLRGRFGR